LTSATSGTGTSVGSTSQGDSGDIKFDVGNPDGGGGPGDCTGGGGGGGGMPEFSYIWIANSPEGTVSKIDTRTGVELGRYVTGPEADRQPSRTSVNLVGDAVVVNRGSQLGGPGSITMIAAVEERCVDKNNNGMIDTSTGPADVRPWGQDECVLWNHFIPSVDYPRGPRPVAWEGTVDQGGCALPNPRVWVGYYDAGSNTGIFRRLDGATGQQLDEVTVTNWSGLNFGPYGGAVNKNGDFIVVGWQQGPLIRIDAETLQVDRWAFPQPPQVQQSWSYGMALDPDGNAWIASAGSAVGFDFASQQWTVIPTTNQSMRGVMVDRQWRAWYAVDGSASFGCGLAVVDTQTKTLLQDLVPLPGCSTPVGVSIDVDGYVWVVDQGANLAFKVDPDTYQIELTVTGLVAPYTYSDMTGGGLGLVVNPPQG